MSRASFPAGDGRLSPDELWTPGCNLFLDIISLKDIDPHLMLVVFLPALLFESACFGIDMGIFLKQLTQICIMAFPAMIFASLITALLLFALAPSSWTFWVCWLIGVISSATDPVAVVALLKELGAAKTLGTLIEGESLLNDGSAVVLFIWVKNCIGYDYATLAPEWMRGVDGERYTGQIGFELLRVIFQMLFFGIILGVSIGYVTKFALKLVYNDRFVEASIIIGMSYLVFWLGELVMGSSAVLAVVVMGLYMNYYRSSISPTVLHFLHEFYEMVAHVLNTVIFLIAGCKVGALIMDASFWDLFLMPHSLSMLILIYPIILLARGLAIAIAFPILKRLGTGCTWKDAVIMWWGGLRGSVGLALGLSVHHMMYDSSMWGTDSAVSGGLTTLNCRDQPMMVLWLTLIVVSSTVIINGVTMAPLMRRLKMTDEPDERLFMLHAASEKLAGETNLFIAQLKTRPELRSVNWETVSDSVVRREMGEHEDIADKDKASWLLVLNLERAFYTAQFEEGVLGAEAYAMLENFMAKCAGDAATTKTSALGKMYDTNFYAMEKKVFKLVSNSAVVAYEVGLSYLASQREVTHLLQMADHGAAPAGGANAPHNAGGIDGTGAYSIRASTMVAPVIEGLVPQDHLTPATAPATVVTLKGQAHLRRRSSLHGLQMVAYEHEDNIAAIRQSMVEVQQAHPQAVREFQTHYATKLMLYEQQKQVKHMLHEGELVDLDANPLLSKIDLRLANLYKPRFKDLVKKDASQLVRGGSAMAMAVSGRSRRASKRDNSAAAIKIPETTSTVRNETLRSDTFPAVKSPAAPAAAMKRTQFDVPAPAPTTLHTHGEMEA